MGNKGTHGWELVLHSQMLGPSPEATARREIPWGAMLTRNMGAYMHLHLLLLQSLDYTAALYADMNMSYILYTLQLLAI